MQGLAGGTLLYIIFFEILPPAHDHDHNSNSTKSTTNEKKKKSHTLNIEGLLRCFCTFLGIMIASYLISISPHNHNHSQSSFSHLKGQDHDDVDHVH